MSMKTGITHPVFAKVAKINEMHSGMINPAKAVERRCRFIRIGTTLPRFVRAARWQGMQSGVIRLARTVEQQ